MCQQIDALSFDQRTGEKNYLLIVVCGRQFFFVSRESLEIRKIRNIKVSTSVSELSLVLGNSPATHPPDRSRGIVKDTESPSTVKRSDFAQSTKPWTLAPETPCPIATGLL